MVVLLFRVGHTPTTPTPRPLTKPVTPPDLAPTTGAPTSTAVPVATPLPMLLETRERVKFAVRDAERQKLRLGL